jgi:hypothetical protein
MYRFAGCPSKQGRAVQVADKWWAGEGSEKPDWEWVAKEAAVVAVDENPATVKPNYHFRPGDRNEL